VSSNANIGSVGTRLRQRTSRRRRQRALLLVAFAIACVTSVAFFLGSSGTGGPTISAGGTTGGAVASVVTDGLSGGTTQGQVTSGLPVAKVIVAKDYVDNAGKNVRISLAWTNASNSALNGKDVIGVGLYYPVATATTSCDSTTVTITDNLTTVCLKQDQLVTGRNVGSSAPYVGLIPLAASLQTGFFIPGTSPGTTPSNCLANGIGSGSWCLLSGESTANTRTMYLIAQVLDPAGHAPPGQQPNPGALQFFVRAKAIGG
jgi:hypothetical protein